jgi:FlaA1/EpsC-like NDP-sugar epimerase
MKADCELKEVGIREGEKLHEIMVTSEDSARTYEYEKNYIIYPHYDWWTDRMVVPGGTLVEPGFEYSSGNNKVFLTVEELRARLKTDLDMH